jgi:hypothetical protein
MGRKRTLSMRPRRRSTSQRDVDTSARIVAPVPVLFHSRQPVAHNTSLEKQQSIARDWRVAELRPFLEPGWRIDRLRGEIEEVPTVLGHYQRGQQLVLRCKLPDCTRRAEVDLRAAIEAGLGERPIKQLLEHLRCGHWRGCALDQASAIYPGGVPLLAYLRHPNAMVAIACNGCGARMLLTPRDVILRLKASGRGDGNTGILTLAKAVRGPCQRCHRRQFTTEVVWLKA